MKRKLKDQMYSEMFKELSYYTERLYMDEKGKPYGGLTLEDFDDLLGYACHLENFLRRHGVSDKVMLNRNSKAQVIIT